MNASYTSTDAAFATPRVPQSQTAPLPAVGLHHSCCREILRLNSENARLHDELERVRAENEDLTKSAELWIRLYETQLKLATARTAATCRP
jgi:hypothetical protein